MYYRNPWINNHSMKTNHIIFIGFGVQGILDVRSLQWVAHDKKNGFLIKCKSNAYQNF